MERDAGETLEDPGEAEPETNKKRSGKRLPAPPLSCFLVLSAVAAQTWGMSEPTPS